MEIISAIFNLLFKFLEFTTGNKRELPDFDFRLERSPMSDNNPLIFLINIANHSKNSYSIIEAIVFKRNEKTKKMLISMKTIIKETDLDLNKNVENRGKIDEQNEKISKKFLVAKDVEQVKILAKSNKYFFSYLKLEESVCNYWKEFRRKTRVQGFISEEGRVFPTWRGSEEWEIVLRDDRGLYWISNRKKIDFPVLEEELRLNNYLSMRFKEGEGKFSEVLRIKIRIIIFNIKYQFSKILIVLGKNNI